MGDKSNIEWTDATWNPTTGCDKVSPGCDNCYAMTLAPRLKAMEIGRGQADTGHYQTDGDPKTSGPGFGFAQHADSLDKPIRWSRPRVIFVNSMSDLFHAKAERQFIARVFAVMALTPRHTYQVLTKRPQIARSVLSDPEFPAMVASASDWLAMTHKVDRLPAGEDWWPLQNVWMGTSVEDQKRANLRVPPLLETPAAHRFLSMEPLLGGVNLLRHVGGDRDGELTYWLTGQPTWGEPETVATPNGKGMTMRGLERSPGIDWIIVGGESGPGARPMHPGWVRHLRDQAAAAGTAFMFKQWGNWVPSEGAPNYRDHWVFGGGISGSYIDRSDLPVNAPDVWRWWAAWAPGTAGAAPGRWDLYGDVLMRHEPDKKAAGRTLDGQTYDDVPGRTDLEHA